VYGTSARIVGTRDEARGQRGAEPVGRVEVAAEHDYRDPPGPRALERGGRRLRTGPGHPGIVEEEDVGVKLASFGVKTARVRIAALPPRPDDQRGRPEPQERSGQLEQGMRPGTAAAGRDHGQVARSGHAGLPPHTRAVIVQESQQQGQQRRPRGAGRLLARLVTPQVVGERGAPDRVGDGHHGVGEQPRAEPLVPRALVATGEPGTRRAAADRADTRAAGRLGRVHAGAPAQQVPAAGRPRRRSGHRATI
jgi:hypothetical protein